MDFETFKENLAKYVKQKLSMEVVSAERNAEFLENVPHKNMEDKLTDSVCHYDSKARIFELAEKFEVRAADRDVEKAAEKETARDADLDEKPSTLAKLKAEKEKIAKQQKKDPVDKHKSKKGPEL